jgi:sialate O-acetylesterase
MAPQKARSVRFVAALSPALLLLLQQARAVRAQSIVGQVLAAPCDPTDASQTQWAVNDGNIGVVSTHGGCLCNSGAGQPLDVRGCVSGDAPEIGYNLTATSPPLPVEWAASGLCVSVATTSTAHAQAAALPLTLLPCSAAASPALAFSASNHSVLVYPATAGTGAPAPLCLALRAPPPPILSTVLGSHMVLQHDQPFALWGHAEAGSTVTATVAGATRTASPDAATGVWVARFPGVPKGGPYTVNVTSTLGSGAPGPSASLADVFFGLVLFASGQSNLSGGNTPLSYVFNATQEIAESALYPWVRVFSVGTTGNGSDAPLPFLAFEPHIPWSVASPASTPKFSAVAWLTAKRVAQALGNGTAIGIIESAWGGTSIQVWLDAATYAGCGDAAPSYPGGWPTAPSSLFNAMVAPFTVGPLRVGGIVWYQGASPWGGTGGACVSVCTRVLALSALTSGSPRPSTPKPPAPVPAGESNALGAEASYYDCALPALITSWRSAFASPGAWVGVAQLAPWASSPPADNEMTAELRASQLKVALALPNVTTATAADGGDWDAPEGSIHPRGKQHIGARLGAGALLALYGLGDPGDSMGPRAVACTPGGGPPGALSATVSFAGVDATSNPLVLVTPQPVGPLANSSVCPAQGVNASLCAGFQLQDATGAWYAATATLSADATRVVLTAAAAPSGAALNASASGWSLWPITLLYNSRGVPAFPWRVGVSPG